VLKDRITDAKTMTLKKTDLSIKIYCAGNVLRELCGGSKIGESVSVALVPIDPEEEKP